MLDLKPWIGFDEGERGRGIPGIAIDQEFEGAEVVVVRGRRKLLGGLDDCPAQAVAQRRARRHLDELLVAALDRAFALPQMADRAVLVADDLHFDMAGVTNEALDIDAVAAEGGPGLGLAARIGVLQPGSVIDDAHAAPPAAGDGLDHDGAALAQRREKGFRFLQAGRAVGALDNGYAALFRQFPGSCLVAEQIQRFGRRSDEDNPLFRATPRE